MDNLKKGHHPDSHFGEIEMSPTTNAALGGASKCRFIICILAILVIVVPLVSVLTYFLGRNDGKTNTLRNVETKTDVLHVYGDFFKTPSVQKKIEKKFFEDPDILLKTPENDTISPRYFLSVCQPREEPDDPSRTKRSPNDSNDSESENTRVTLNPSKSGQNNGHQIKRLRREASGRKYHYHGCCVSFRTFISPEDAISDHNNQKVDLVHFGNDNRQYFLVDVCWHESSCRLRCGCRQQVGLFRALIHNPAYDTNSGSDVPRYVVNTIRLDGGCKCMNNLSPSVYTH